MNKKLTTAQIIWIRETWRSRGKYSTSSLARRFEVSVWTIRDIVAGRSYADIFLENMAHLPVGLCYVDDPEEQLKLLESTEELQ